jgi:CubicO group peptidase (beta-lactamase class C family)
LKIMYFEFSYLISRKNAHITLLLFLLTFLAACMDSREVDSPYPEAEEQGIDGDKLAEAFSYAKSIPDLQGLAVARNGIIVAEEYYSEAGSLPDSELHVMSVTKSVSSTLIGIAIEEGYIESVDQTLSDFLGEEVDSINPELGEVSIHQLLTMTGGQNWHELGGDSEFGHFVRASDQVNYILEKPIVHPPGTVFNYSDGSAHLVSVILSEATGKSASEFADAQLFGPMGLGDRLWYSDNRGISYGGVGLCIGIHDMVAIGYLYLNEGSWHGEQLVPSHWIHEATGFKIATENVIPFLSDYGYYWWLGSAHGHNFICANGYGGQFIFIVKDLNLVVCSRTNYRGITSAQAGENWYNILDVIINKVLTSVKE